MNTVMIGLGDINSSWLNVYIANRPPLDEYTYLDELKPLQEHDVAFIAQETGNHWRKIFNVYAKFIHAYMAHNHVIEQSNVGATDQPSIQTWQMYRDTRLLQNKSGIRLLFTPPDLGDVNSCASPKTDKPVHIIMGKQYAIDLGYYEDNHEGMTRLDKDFVIWPNHNLIVCPYFDYRQLSNVKIERLIELVKGLS
jgi:hypothetical protein